MANFKHISIDGTSYDAVPAESYVTGVKGSAERTYRTGNVNITKANVGLSNVPNVTTNNQTPTFTQASTRANIASGETLATIFSKIMKWFADLKTVAFTGAYSDLSGTPTIPTVNNATLTIQKNGTDVQTFTANASSNKTANITVPTKTSELTNDSGYITNAGVTGVKGDSETNYRTGNVNITKSNIGLGNVGNFKAVSTTANQGLSDTEKSNARTNIGAGTSSFSGSYNDLTNKPTIPTVNNATLTIQKNGTKVQTFTANQSSNVTANITMSKSDVGLGNVGNFKAVSTTANQGLSDTEKSNARTNIGAGTSSFSGSYNDLTNKPTIPTVNNATLTIQKNGTNVQTFTANASSNKTANITVPTKTSELTNDSGYITNAGVTGVKGNSETNYRTGNVNITKSNIGLGNVPNVTTNNQTPTFTQASNNDNLVSGEKLSISLGKIMHFIDAFLHLAGTVTYLPVTSDFISNYLFGNDHLSNAIVFSNWSDTTNFPSIYGSGIALPCVDVSNRIIIYMDINANGYIGHFKSTASSITKTWKKITTTNV